MCTIETVVLDLVWFEHSAPHRATTGLLGAVAGAADGIAGVEAADEAADGAEHHAEEPAPPGALDRPSLGLAAVRAGLPLGAGANVEQR